MYASLVNAVAISDAKMIKGRSCWDVKARYLTLRLNSQNCLGIEMRIK